MQAAKEAAQQERQAGKDAMLQAAKDAAEHTTRTLAVIAALPPEEYREITPYWCKRFLGFDTALFSYRYNYESCNVKNYTHVLLRYGYTKRCFIRKIDSITIGRGRPEWGAPADRDVFIIRHHKEDSPIIKGKEL